jgi:hypothetical protein
MTPCRRPTSSRVARLISQSKANARHGGYRREADTLQQDIRTTLRGVRQQRGAELLARALGCLLQGELLLRVEVIFDHSEENDCH